MLGGLGMYVFVHVQACLTVLLARQVQARGWKMQQDARHALRLFLNHAPVPPPPYPPSSPAADGPASCFFSPQKNGRHKDRSRMLASA